MPTMMTRTDAATPERLLLALDLGNRTWKLGFTVGGGALPPRIRTITARDLTTLASDAPVVSCYEAGRDGFWVHRARTTLGVANVVVDSASIERTRRARQVQSDRRDTTALLNMLGRFSGGERGVWSVVHVPSVDDEDRRQLHRELVTITRERTRVVNRIKALLALHGVVLDTSRGLPVTQPAFPALAAWNGAPLPPEAHARLTREWNRLTFLRGELRTLVTARQAMLRTGTDAVVPMGRRLLALRGIGEVGAWIYTTKFFAWRQFRNRRQVGAAAGLCSTLRESGDVRREQGMSKAGNRYLRALAIALAWSWLRRQPQSALSRWYRVRFAAGGSRVRRIGIVALARTLLIARWRYLETGVLPEGAQWKA